MHKKREPCPECGSTNAKNIASKTKRNGQRVTEFKCRKCGRCYSVNVSLLKPPARVLILDIETAPINAYVWGLWKQNINGGQLISDWFGLTWSAKWLFESEVISAKLTSKEALAQDDSRIMKGIWSLVDEAEVIIAHNGDNFDMPKLNTRFLLCGLKPPMPYQTIDTLKVLRRVFAFSSNRLDSVNKAMGLGRKTETGGFQLWADCMNGNKDALAKMEEYNVMDVQILEELYVELRPWIKSHPNMGLFVETDEEVCPTCASTQLDYRGYYHTNVGKYESFRCKDCGAIGRRRKTIFDKDKNKSILASVAR